MINVSNIERFATHDGPGIRTTLFMMGCSLRCPWCANPETWTLQSVLMHDTNKCIECRACQKACKNHAITFDPFFQWDQTKCKGCQDCVWACLQDALKLNGQWMEVQEILEEVLKDWDYYQASGGGLTLSGGEPFFQFDEVFSLLKNAKKAGLHVAVETTGNVEPKLFEKAIPYVDLFLFDIKHLDPVKLEQVTYANAQRIFSNFETLCLTRSKDVIVRVPVIEGFNDQILSDIIEYSKQHNVQKVHLLPYHSLGKTKWEQLKREYIYGDLEMMKEDTLKQYESDFVQIGG